MILSIDAGTSGVTAIAVQQDGTIAARGFKEFSQHYPQPGWVEHDLEEIWEAVLAAVTQVIERVGKNFQALGITNQRETICLWDRNSLKATRKAIVWQDRRTTGILQDLREHPTFSKVQGLTGLPLDPYFSASKLRWIALSEPEIWREVRDGRAIVGTIDSYLIARASNGVHVTDASNASRTQLYDIHNGVWSEELADMFGLPISALPRIVNSSGEIARTDPTSFLELSIPISGIAGDQQAALFGQTQFDVGGAKCTYGTGAFILQNTGTLPVMQNKGLITTVAWQLAGVRTYAIEGSVFIAGAAVQWLRDELGLFSSSAEIEALALSVADSGGVVLVPALSGLGAPYWEPDARGALLGLTRGTGRAHIARAALESIAFQVRDVFSAMESDGVQLAKLRVDGGASENNLLLQLQADQLGIEIQRPEHIESTALGASYLAGLGVGYWQNLSELQSLNPVVDSFKPVNDGEAAYLSWQKAVGATIAFTAK